MPWTNTEIWGGHCPTHLRNHLSSARWPLHRVLESLLKFSVGGNCYLILSRGIIGAQSTGLPCSQGEQLSLAQLQIEEGYTITAQNKVFGRKWSSLKPEGKKEKLPLFWNNKCFGVPWQGEFQEPATSCATLQRATRSNLRAGPTSLAALGSEAPRILFILWPGWMWWQPFLIPVRT